MIALTLPDMTCGHCVRAVTDTVQQVDPAAKLEIDLPGQQVRIDSALPAEQFVQALRAADYPPA